MVLYTRGSCGNLPCQSVCHVVLEKGVDSCSQVIRDPDKVHIFIPKTPISGLNPMFDLLLESSHRDDSNKRSNIGYGQEIMELVLIRVYFMHVIWSSESLPYKTMLFLDEI